MEKKDNDEYHKIHIAVWSDNRKAKVQMCFSVREKSEKCKKEANENAAKPKKCIACGNGEDKCTGYLGTNCSWREVIIAEWLQKKKTLFDAVTPFVKGATIVQAAPVNEAEQKVKKYLTKVKGDNDQERKIRIRNFLAHNVQNEVQRQKLGEGKSIDDAGYVQVSKKKTEKQRVLKRTIHKPYTISDFKNVASYAGGFAIKDRIVATLYRWPSKQHEGSRVKTLMANLSLKQLSELVAKCGAKDNRTGLVSEHDKLEFKIWGKGSTSKEVQELDCNGHKLKMKESIRILGLHLNSKLNFTEDIEDLITKLRQRAGMIRIQGKHLPMRYRMQLYQGWIVRSSLGSEFTCQC